MTLRDDVIPVIDEARELVDDLGLRLCTVQTRLRTWTGSVPGDGSSSDVDTDIEPTPKVREPWPRLIADAPGTYETGDRLISKVSATYTEAQLTGGTLFNSQEWWILIDGDPHRVMGVEKRTFEWRIHVRRLTGR